MIQAEASAKDFMQRILCVAVMTFTLFERTRKELLWGIISRHDITEI